MTIIVIGYGAIGTPMGRRLVSTGHAVAAVDPSPAARDRAVGDGMTAYESIADAPTGETVLVLVATGEQLLDCVKAGTSGREVAGETWVISSTVGPRAAHEATDLLVAAGARVVDAPVTGGVPGAEAGTLRFLVAGPADAVARLSPTLSVMGSVVVVGERPGDGQATKLVNQLCSSVHLAAAAEAIALSTRLGLDPVRTASVIAGGSGASWFFDDRGPRMADLDVDPDVRTRLAILAKDNGLVEQEADASGARVPLLKAAKAQYSRAAELGLLDADDSQIIRTYLD